MLRSIILVFLLALALFSACSSPSWFPIKKGVPHKAKMKELLDKEVIILDKEEYVKVTNPKASEGGDQPRYLYIPVDEYLAKRETFTTPVSRREMNKESSTSSMEPLPAPTGKELFQVSSKISAIPNLKKKVVISQFNSSITPADEEFGDWVVEKLIKEVNQRSQRILFIDYHMVKEFLEKRGIVSKDLGTKSNLHLLNEVFGIHALAVGHLSGPYVFTTKSGKDQDGTASAIVKMEMKLMDTFSGRTLKNLSTSNPIIATKEKGPFSEEKAKIKAFDLTIADLSRSLAKELEGMDWFCRIAKVDGEEIYINAGKLTGLKVGDVMEVFPPEGPGSRGEVKGRIKISACFGIDASIGKLIFGKKPDVNDILKLSKGEGS